MKGGCISKQKKKSISAGITINILAIVVLRCVNVITAPVMTGILSTEDYGVFSVFNTWASTLCIVSGLGVVGSLTNFRVNYKGEGYFKYCWNMLLLGIIGHMFMLAILMPAKHFIGNVLKLPFDLIPLLAISAMFSFCTSLLSMYFIIENMATYNAVISLVMVAGSFGTSILFVFFRQDENDQYISFIEGHLLVSIIIGLICIVFLYKKSLGRINIAYMKYGLHIGVPLIFHSLAGVVLGSSDRIMIQHMDGLSSAGVYAFTYNFACILASVWQAINSIWTPYFFGYLRDNDVENLEIKKKNFDFVFLTLTIGFLLVYPEVFRLLADEKYWGQMKIIPIIVSAFFANHLYSYPANYETFKEKTIYVATGSIGAAIVNIFLNFLLIPTMHEIGAAIATAISYFALLVFHYYIGKNKIGAYPFKGVVSKNYVIVFFMAICLLFLCYDYWIARWIIAGCVALVLAYDVVKRRNIL